jgi:hypothetical protein
VCVRARVRVCCVCPHTRACVLCEDEDTSVWIKQHLFGAMIQKRRGHNKIETRRQLLLGLGIRLGFSLGLHKPRN